MKDLHINLASPISIYVQLGEQLRSKIQNGEWPPGTRLPSELALAKQLNISRGTARQAMMMLVSEGLVERAQGKGTYVSAASQATNKLIGAILPYKHDTLTLDILIGIEKTVKAQDYHVIFSQTEGDPQAEARDVQQMRAKGVAGLIVFPPSNIEHDETIALLHAEQFPFVLVDRYLPNLPTDYVVVDNFAGGYEATRHLLALGHCRIGFLTPSDLKTTSVRDRFFGYQRALAEYDVPYEEALFFRYRGLMRPDPDLVSIQAYLSHPRRPSAVFAVTDLLAIRVLEAAQRQSLRVPDDLAIVGFDDITQAAQVSVPLTTVAQPRVEIGVRAGEVLLERLNGAQTPPIQIVLPIRLIVRESSGGAV